MVEVVTDTFDRACGKRIRPREPSVLDKTPFICEPCRSTCSTREIDEWTIRNRHRARLASPRIGRDLSAGRVRPARRRRSTRVQAAAERFRGLGADVIVVETDLATTDGVDRLWTAAAGRPVDALVSNAGHGLGRAFLDQDFANVLHVIDTNVTGTVYLVQLVGRANAQPRTGTYSAHRVNRRLHARNLSSRLQRHQAFVDSFSFALLR